MGGWGVGARRKGGGVEETEWAEKDLVVASLVSLDVYL